MAGKKKLNKVDLVYESVDQKGEEVGEFIGQVMRDVARAREELAIVLVSQPYLDIYEKLREKKSILADFILYA